MDQANVFDFVVIGAGMAGASLGYELAQAGVRALVLEREAQPGYHSTGRSAAMFMESYGTPHTRALTKASRAFFLNPPDGFAEHPILTPRSVLYVAQHGQEELLEQACAAYAAEGIEVERLTPEQALTMVPCLKQEHLFAAILDPVASDMDVHGLHQGYLKGMRQKGVALQCGADICAAAWQNNRWTITLASGQTITAGALVNAAGAWADSFAQLCGITALGIEPRRRTAFLFEPPANVDTRAWPTVLGVDESYYFKPDAGLLLGSPANADPVAAQDVVAEELDVAIGIHRITEATTLEIHRPRHVWAGLRSFAPDSEFVIGWDANHPAFFWLAGQGGYGIQTAAAASALACSLLLRKAVPPALAQWGVSADAVNPARLQPIA